jgi:hypothetical protein
MPATHAVRGTNADAPFRLSIHRGEGMALLAMNWRKGKPPVDFVGFGIEYREPGGDRFFALKNRLTFKGAPRGADGASISTLQAPIQKFRWVHFPRNADMKGDFTYRVTPIFMNAEDELSHGPAQEASLQLATETHSGRMNVTFTRGFVSSQAFVDRYESKGPIRTLLPAKADDGLDFRPTHPNAKEALAWMGFEARREILAALDAAIADRRAKVAVVAYDLSEPEVVGCLERLGARLRIVIDDDGPHGKPHSAETRAAERLARSAGAGNVKRQHLGKLQHNKTIVVDGPKVKLAVGGSTNFSWRGLYVQSNNAVIVRGARAIAPFQAAFEQYWASDSAKDFGLSAAATWTPLGLRGIDARVTFSPHSASNAALADIADDIASAKSSLFFSLAFLYQTPGAIRDAIAEVSKKKSIFVYGVSDRKVGGLDLRKPDGTVSVVAPAALAGAGVPLPFRAEPTGGGGTRLHHKFLVVDFDKPTARVYFGSYNFSKAADASNGENLFLVRDRRVATSYALEALRIVDHYHFRAAQADAKRRRKELNLQKPPRAVGETPWWEEDWRVPIKIRDRELFA